MDPCPASPRRHLSLCVSDLHAPPGFEKFSLFPHSTSAHFDTAEQRVQWMLLLSGLSMNDISFSQQDSAIIGWLSTSFLLAYWRGAMAILQTKNYTVPTLCHYSASPYLWGHTCSFIRVWHDTVTIRAAEDKSESWGRMTLNPRPGWWGQWQGSGGR